MTRRQLMFHSPPPRQAGQQRLSRLRHALQVGQAGVGADLTAPSTAAPWIARSSSTTTASST